MGLATSFGGNKALEVWRVSLNGIAASALSALKTSSAALGVVSNNVANLNTPGYARRVVNEQTLAAGGQLMGVDIASVQRVVDQFLQQENYAASGSASQYDIQAGLFTQLNGLLGGPGDNQSLATGLTNLSAAFATASQAPSSSSSFTAVLNALNGVASDISNVSSTISTLQSQVDSQVVSSISSTNVLIKQIYALNQQIKTASAAGDTSSALLDQRDVALTSLSKVMGIRVNQQADGGVNVTTTDGINLVSNTYAVLSYSGGTQNGTYGNVQIQDTNPQSGQMIGSGIALDPHLSSGSLKGLIDMRDQTLGGLAQSLGNFAQNTAQAFNAQANANVAYPPPTALTGRDTGLLAGDALNFAGKTTIAVADSSGNLVSRIDVDFGAGTLSVDGGGRQHPTRIHRHQLHRVIRDRQQQSGKPGDQLLGGAGDRQCTAAHRPGHARHYAQHRCRQFHNRGRGQFRRHCVSERHLQGAQLSGGGRHYLSDRVAVRLRRGLLPGGFNAIERGHHQSGHAGRPASGSPVAPGVQFRRQSRRGIDQSPHLPAGL